MSTQPKTKTAFETFLRGHDEEAWEQALAELLPTVHEVDRTATRIWFHFFPLALCRAFEEAEDPSKLAQELLMQGSYHLKDQVDSSHTFLYGHRFWPETKRAVVGLAESTEPLAGVSLAQRIREVAEVVASSRRVEPSLALGIAAVALMTLRQSGLEAFSRTPGEMLIDRRHLKKSPDKILKERAKDDSQGLFGFLRTTDKLWTVVWDENKDDRRFSVVNMQEVASGAATDTRDWSQVDPRCTVDEGPIPVQCRSASCGTCWVGVLGGAEKLTPVATREKKLMPLLGYIETDEAQPVIRLSCQAQGKGAASIVIPPWNGFFGKYLKKQREAQDSKTGARSQTEVEV
ncbi:MAG: (2Fe-2S)-binding protein [Acidobacteria bacterium]|nr:(2Fe-2S)-binding protein [Acidobacteriota bacterium]